MHCDGTVLSIVCKEQYCNRMLKYNIEEEDMFIPNVSENLPDYMASHSRKRLIFVVISVTT
jgi:hypothetical protein